MFFMISGIYSNVLEDLSASDISSIMELKNLNTTSDTLPSDFPELIIVQNEEPATGYLFGSSNSTVDSIGNYFMIIDNSGNPLFYSQTQSAGRLLCNGYFATAVPLGPKHQFIWYIKDQSFNIVDSFQMGNGYIADNHDFVLLPNGHAIMLAYDIQYIDMSKIVEGGHPYAKVTGSIIQELDVDKNVVYQWRCWDHIPITDSYKDITKSGFDYIHVNSVELDNDGHIILSCRETSEVIKINRETGETIWRWGGKNNDFTILGDHEENAPRYFKLQHSVRRVSNGNIIMFDNGADKNDLERTYSRAVEYDMDEEGMTTTMVWEYRHDPDILALSGGTVVRHPNGNTSINWGGAARDGTAPGFTEANPDGDLVYEISFTSPDVTGNFSRYLWFDLAPVQSVTHLEVVETNTYEFSEGDSIVTGISLEINSYTGDGYNEVTVQRESYGPLYPEFVGRAPMVFAERIHISGNAITSINADIIFDLDEFDFTDPDSLVIYHREFPGTGLFLPLVTDYNSITNIMKATTEQFGEFIVGKQDFISAKHPPMLLIPKDSGYVNYSLPVNLLWTPIGYVNEFSVQVASDSLFTELLLDEENLKETSVTMNLLENNQTYFWRVHSVNDAGVSDWSVGRFFTTNPSITINVPNGSENWQVGFEYMIRWDDNIEEDVTLALYKNEEFYSAIDTVSSTGYYEWEIDPDLTPGTDYKIKIASISADTVFDINLEPFTVIDTIQTSVSHEIATTEKNRLHQNYPNPFYSSTIIEYELIQNDNVTLIMYDSFGREVKTLVSEYKPAGTYSFTLNASEFANGIYFLKMTTSSFSQVRKMILIK